MSPAAVYMHFRTKEDVLFALSLLGHQQSQQIVDEAATTSTTPAAQAFAIARSFATWHAENHVIARVVQYEMAALSSEHVEHIAVIRRSIENVLGAVIDRGVSVGHFRVRSTRMSALAILSLGIDVARWYRQDGLWSPAEIGEFYGEMAMRMLGIESDPVRADP